MSDARDDAQLSKEVDLLAGISHGIQRYLAMIKHCVLFKLRPGAPKSAVDTSLRDLAGLVGRIPGLLDFSGGSDCFPQTRNRGYTHGFVMTFDTAASRDAYLPHPDHVRVAESLIQLVEGGYEGTLVIDFEV